MLYSDFINQTLSNNNDIEWNYYNSHVNTDDIFNGLNSKEFIYGYFKNGVKTLPFFINADTANKFIERYFTAGRKNFALSFNYDEQYQMPQERAIHTVSGFFLGLLIENCINGIDTLSVDSPNYYPFSYLWFLTFLYHDYGYCVTERDDCPIQFPEHAPIPNEYGNYKSRITIYEYNALSQIKAKLGIDLSPFSPSPFPRCYEHSRQPNIEHALLRELTQRNYTIQGNPKLRFRGGYTIREHRYTSSVVTRYMNYCINEFKHVDHGIVGGYLFYDRMIKNYMMAYLSATREENTFVDLSDFHYQYRHFCSEQLKIFSYISDCILSHNIWKQPDDKREIYKQYNMDDLFSENFKSISYEENPLLYILVVTDSIEPVKIYQKEDKHLSAEQIINAINIEFIPKSHTLKFSSCSNIVDIGILHQKAKGLESWTSVKCSALRDGNFTLSI